MKIKQHKAVAVRKVTQISTFILVFLISASKWIAENGIKIPFLPDASLHAICPFGGVATIYEFAASGNFIQKIHSSSFILMILGVIVAVLFGALFAGIFARLVPFKNGLEKSDESCSRRSITV